MVLGGPSIESATALVQSRTHKPVDEVLQIRPPKLLLILAIVLEHHKQRSPQVNPGDVRHDISTADAPQHGTVDPELACDVVDPAAFLRISPGYRTIVELVSKDIRVEESTIIEFEDAMDVLAGAE